MIYSPYRYQAYCIDRVVSNPSVGLFLDMGLGKTSITLSAIRELKYNRFQVHKVLIIAPKKVAEGTWTKERDKWDHTKLLRISLVLGAKAKRIKALHTPADVYIVNRENTGWLVDYYRNDWPFDMVVLDESSSFKSHKAKRFKALKSVMPHIKRMVALTGTPSPNGLGDLWSQVYLLDGGERLGKSFHGFRERYMEPDKRSRERVFSYKAKDFAEESIKAKISDICISMKADDYLELPDIIYQENPVVLDDKAMAKYRELERKMLVEIDDMTVVDVASAAALSNKLLQLGNGAIYDEFKDIHEIHDCKIEALHELLEELEGQPVLVFYNYQHDLKRIRESLSGSKKTIKQLKTTDDEDAWNRGEIDILLAHPASTAYGLNLQEGGNHVIWFGLTWNLEHYQQANKRLHRQGQSEKVFIHHLVSQGTRDEDVMTALEGKGDVQEELLRSLKARIEEYQKEVTDE